MNTKITFLAVLAMTAGIVMSCKKSEKGTAPPAVSDKPAATAPAEPTQPQPAAPKTEQPPAPATMEAKPADEEAALTKAPAFTLMDQDGKAVSLSSFAGKIVVLEWTNPECPYVKSRYASKAIPTLAKTYMEKGVIWLAINSTKDFDIAKNKAWHTEHKLTYPMLDDHAGKVGKEYHAKTTPHMFLIDVKGNLAYQGALDSDNSTNGKDAAAATHYVKESLDDLLAGKAPRHSQTKSYGCSIKYAD